MHCHSFIFHFSIGFFNLTIKASLATPSLWVVLAGLGPLTGDQFDQEGPTQFT